MRAVAYCRVSSSSDMQLNSLKNQIDHYTNLFEDKKHQSANVGVFCKRDGEVSILNNGIFADEGITGTQKKNRKAFNKMMEMAQQNYFEVIYCKSVQRFARNTGEGSTALKKLKSLGVKVIFEEGNLDSSNIAHELVIDMLLGVAQSESQTKSVSVKFGIKRAQKQGKWTGNKPFGYDRVEGYLQVNEEEADIVKKIYSMYVDKRYGQNKIAKILDETYPNPSGKEWYQQRIRDILVNPLYKGKQIQGKTENMDVNIIDIKVIPESDWRITEREDLQIIPDDTWQQAQDIYEANKKKFSHYKGGKDKSTNTFSSIVFCDNCGGLMRRKQKRTKVKQKMVTLDTYEWICANNHNKGRYICKFRNYVNEDVLYQYAKDMIIGFREGKELLDQSFKKYLYVNFDNSNIEETITNLDNEISELKRQRDNRFTLYDKGILNDTELKEYTDSVYRPAEKKLMDERFKYLNIEKELTRVKRQYRDFLKTLDSIDVDNLTNADIKKVFSGIYVGTYEEFYSNNFIFMDNSDYDFSNPNLDKLPYTWVNQNKGTFKHISCDMNFMGKNEMDLFEEMAEKDYQKILASKEHHQDEIAVNKDERVTLKIEHINLRLVHGRRTFV